MTTGTFRGLPDDWARRPMTDPDLFEGVVDLAVFEAFRATGGVALLLCHADGRLMQPVTVETVNAASPPCEAEARLAAILADIVGTGVPAVVMVVARPGSAAATERDRDLRDAFVRASRASGITLLGSALAVPGVVVDLTPASATEAA
ncbi:MAG TPA: hypothetical protein VIR15_08100 [Intrasporangium sp.]|jgi:hypothetical protein|uniref:hypothetical protein n=1 Tax=Intrasporangium sp. TaxID=1925024 RepID=UPI002F95CEF0